jgi:hypothetical protein
MADRLLFVSICNDIVFKLRKFKKVLLGIMTVNKQQLSNILKIKITVKVPENLVLTLKAGIRHCVCEQATTYFLYTIYKRTFLAGYMIAGNCRAVKYTYPFANLSRKRHRCNRTKFCIVG